MATKLIAWVQVPVWQSRRVVFDLENEDVVREAVSQGHWVGLGDTLKVMEIDDSRDLSDLVDALYQMGLAESETRHKIVGDGDTRDVYVQSVQVA